DVLFAWTQPEAGLQASSVQGLPSLQFEAGPPAHAPPLQASFVVQALPSLHGLVLFVWTHPEAGSHESSVQGLPSLQLIGGPPTHAPPLQASFVVQALPSSQADVLLVWTHPVAGLHESSVQRLPSLQFGGAPPTHTPPLHASFVVHALASLQAAVSLFVWTQPVAGLQESSVQGLPSSQFSGAP